MVQKFVLPRKVTLQCGRLRWQADTMVRELAKEGWQRQNDFVEWAKHAPVGMERLCMHRSVMQGHNALRRTYDLGETLFMCENYHCFDRRDKIFALLALCRPSYRPEIEVDYSLSLVDTFLQVVECNARIETKGQTRMWVACLLCCVWLRYTGNHLTVKLVCRNIHIQPKVRCHGGMFRW